jgi:hypothetical protein
MTLKLRMDTFIEVEAADFVETADYQGAVQRCAETMHSESPEIATTIKTRRRRLTPVKHPEKLRRSGAVHRYVDRRHETA